MFPRKKNETKNAFDAYQYVYITHITIHAVLNSKLQTMWDDNLLSISL